MADETKKPDAELRAKIEQAKAEAEAKVLADEAEAKERAKAEAAAEKANKAALKKFGVAAGQQVDLATCNKLSFGR